MKHIFIVNPVAGKKNASTDLVPEIIRQAALCGAEYEIYLTEKEGHATEIARSCAQTGEEIFLYACGGDGTLHEVIQGAIGYANVAVGCIPCGSGNDFIRNFGTKEDFLKIDEQINGGAVETDLIKTPYGYAASTCSAGLDAQVAMGIDKWRHIPGCGGSMAYILSAGQEICGKLGMELTVQVDEETLQGEYLMAAICNGRAYGGGFIAAPDARVDDGLLDVILVRKISRLQILPLLGRYRAGRHFKDGKICEDIKTIIEFRRGKQVTVTPARDIVVNVDGECSVREKLTAEVVPGAIRMVLPHALYEKYQTEICATADVK